MVEDRQGSVCLEQLAASSRLFFSLIEEVFKYRFFQSQRGNWGQRGVQDIRLGMRAYAQLIPEILTNQGWAGLWVCRWKRP